MKELNPNNPYGYKVGYRENGSRRFIRHLITNTYDLANWEMERYKKMKVRSRKDNHIIFNPIWEVVPLRRLESLIVWRDCPF